MLYIYVSLKCDGIIVWTNIKVYDYNKSLQLIFIMP